MPHVTINNLGVRYNGHAALHDINLALPDGQIIAIIGPSGCGKTTLLKSINRLLELNTAVKVTGNVCIDGKDIYAPDADLLTLRKKIGFLSQRPYPLPYSIFDNVAFGPRIHRMTPAEIAGVTMKLDPGYTSSGRPGGGRLNIKKSMKSLVECCLRKAGLWEEVKDRLHHSAHALSIGQQQRLALARALAVGPETILADEPTSALDPISTARIEEQFKQLKSQFTIVMVTHILRQAKRLADYGVFMYMGELIEHGPVPVLFGEPKHELTQAYVKGDMS